MAMSEQERKEKARIFDRLVDNYGGPGQVLNSLNHTNVFTQDTGTYGWKV